MVGKNQESKRQKAEATPTRSALLDICCLLPVVLSQAAIAQAQDTAAMLSLENGALFVFHPFFVHFAIALLLFGFAVDWLGSMFEQEQAQYGGRLCFLAGVAALGLAVMSGWIEQELPRPPSVFDDAMQTVLFRHEYLGYGLFAFFLVLAVIRLRVPGRLPVLYVALGMLGVIGVVMQGYLGGELVYRYGAGVRAVQVLSEQVTSSEQKQALKRCSKACAGGQIGTAHPAVSSALNPTF